MRPGAVRRLGFGLACGAVAGCTLVDQNTFNPHAGDRPGYPSAEAAPARAAGAQALVTVAAGSTGYAEAVGRAAAQARARRPGVMFDVVEFQASDAAAETVGAAAAGVGQAIVAAGVEPGRVRLDVRPEAGVRAGEVRVYVR